MWKIVCYTTIQCLLLVGGQVLLKLALSEMPPFAWRRTFWLGLLTNFHFALAGLLLGAAGLLWMYILKTFPFSMAYPMVSLSYVFGMLAAVLFLHEEVTATRWAGVALIVAGCMMVASARGQNVSEVQARQKIEQAARELKTLQCDFVQTKHLGLLGGEALVSRGHLSYSASEGLRWEYVKPYQYTLVLAGDKVHIRNKAGSNVFDVGQNKLFREIATVMKGCLVGGSLLAGSGGKNGLPFKSSLSTAGGEWVATLLPLRGNVKQMFQKITLHFDQQQALVSRVELTEKNGDQTIIDLTNTRKNETLPSALFDVE